MKEFLTKNADTAIVEIRDKLYQRLTANRDTIDTIKGYDTDTWYFALQAIKDENNFLSDLLDLIERS